VGERSLAEPCGARRREALTWLVRIVTVALLERSTLGTPRKGTERLRVGVVGCGLVAQVMHLHYLRECSDRFEVVAICDLVPETVAHVAESFPAAKQFQRWEELVAEPLDAVLVLTPGSHAPIAIAAAEADLHVFVEKPMCFSVEEAQAMIAAAEQAGVFLMVGYMKRYDPAYEELADRLAADTVRFARITTLESPLEPYVAHYPLRRGELDPELLAQLLDDDEQRVSSAIGSDDPVVRRAYRVVLLDSMVHELNAVRGLLGEPTALRFSDIWGEPDGITATLCFGATECVVTWVDLPGIARYEQELAFYAPDVRMTLAFPSPFLRNMPTRLVIEEGEVGTPSSSRTVKTVSYEEAFKRELCEFHECIVEEREPRTPGLDGLRDIALAQAIVRSHLEGRPVDSPTLLTEVEDRPLH
jgi:predicted dehydrogenase